MSLATLHEALASKRSHLTPFFMLGDPTPALSIALVEAAVRAGATMIELGFPYSDPVADGPAIQAAGQRALGAGTSTPQAFELLAEIRRRVDVPLNLLVYGNLVHARGEMCFARDAVEAGASSLLVPDIPFEEGAALREACAHAELGLVHFLGPRSQRQRAELLATDATAFVYLAGIQGVTGTRAFSGVEHVKRHVANVGATPLAVGFGLRTHTDLRAVFDAGARLAVVGSSLARVIERHVGRGDEPNELIAAVSAQVGDLAESARPHFPTPSLGED